MMSQEDSGALTLSGAQQLVDNWIQSIGVRYFNELTNLAQLTEEVGELARILSRQYGEQSSKPGEEIGDPADELADILFVVICLANQMNINLEKSLLESIQKKTQRDKTRHQENEKLIDDSRR